MDELKPCPFCDGKAECYSDVAFKAETGEQIGTIKWFAWCTECSALVSADTKDGVIAAWNRRANNG